VVFCPKNGTVNFVEWNQKEPKNHNPDLSGYHLKNGGSIMTLVILLVLLFIFSKPTTKLGIFSIIEDFFKWVGKYK